ncbi:MAG: glycerol-3-phosphate acyltransferase [Anaerolineales bacterium]
MFPYSPQLNIFLFTILGFCSGAIPFSLYLTLWTVGKDIRQIADGNPGPTNAWRAAGWSVGLLAYFLEISKAVVPVLLAVHRFGVRGWGILPVALAPTLGHVFSPLLKGRGGKGLATILGAWIGISIIEIPLVILIILVPLFLWLRKSLISLLLTGGLTLLYLLILRRDPAWIVLLLVQLLLITWTHRSEFPISRRLFPLP